MQETFAGREGDVNILVSLRCLQPHVQCVGRPFWLEMVYFVQVWLQQRVACGTEVRMPSNFGSSHFILFTPTTTFSCLVVPCADRCVW